MRDAFGVERVEKGLPSALRTGNALSPYARNLQRKNKMGQTAGRAVARARLNPPKQKAPKPQQLALLERKGPYSKKLRPTLQATGFPVSKAMFHPAIPVRAVLHGTDSAASKSMLKGARTAAQGSRKVWTTSDPKYASQHANMRVDRTKKGKPKTLEGMAFGQPSEARQGGEAFSARQIVWSKRGPAGKRTKASVKRLDAV